MVIFRKIHSHEVIDILILDLVEIGHNLAERHIIHVIAEAHLSLDLISIGYSHVVHLVSETDYPHILRVSPRSCNPLPHCYVLQGLRILPVAHHCLVVLAHTCKDVTELTVSVGTLVEVHKVHIHSLPRNLLVVLSVEMEERLAELLHSVYPHLCRRESVHPGDHTDAFLVCLCRTHYVRHLIGRVRSTFIDHLDRKNAGSIHSLNHCRRVAVHLHNCVAAIQKLRSCDEPYFVIFKCLDHNISKFKCYFFFCP